MIATFYNGEPGIKRISALPILITVFGGAMPFFAKDRKALVVQTVDGKYKWKPEMQFSKEKRQEIQKLQENILNTCLTLGVTVHKDITLNR